MSWHWWKGQNLEKPIAGPDGKTWHFLAWSGDVDGNSLIRIFFWDDEKIETGLLQLPADQVPHISRLRHKFRKLAKDREYRKQFLRPLQFPLERHW